MKADIWVKLVITMLSAAFLAWAGVVWNASNSVRDQFSRFEVLMVTELGEIKGTLIRLEQRIDAHEKGGPHDDVQRSLDRLSHKLDTLTKHVQRRTDF